MYAIVGMILDVMTMDEHKKGLRDRDGGIEEHINKDLEEANQAYAKAKIERARRRKEAAEQAKKREFSEGTAKMIAGDNEKGEVAAIRKEYEKENAAYEKRKEAFNRLVEERKAQKARA